MDIETFSQILTRVAILTPVLTGVVEALKVVGIPGRFLPLVAIALGACSGFFLVSASILGAVAGVAIGLSAVGLYEFGKTTVMGK